MVDINLIPPALRKNGDQDAAMGINFPQEALLGVGSGLIFLLVTIHLVLGAIWLLKFQQLSVKKAQWAQVLPDKNTWDSLNSQSRDLKKKTDMIADMTVKKSILWSPKFNAISDAIPKGLWLRKLTLDRNGLSIEGSVVSKTESEINNVGLFISALKQDPDFKKDFYSLEVNSIQRGKANTVDVTDFTVMAKLK